MIIVTHKGVTQDEIDHIRERVESMGLRTHISMGEHRTIIGCVGDEALLHHVPLLSIPGVDAVHEVLKPYKLASNDFAAAPTEVPIGDARMGGPEVIVISSPAVGAYQVVVHDYPQPDTEDGDNKFWVQVLVDSTEVDLIESVVTVEDDYVHAVNIVVSESRVVVTPAN